MSGIWIAIGVGLLGVVVTYILQTGELITSYIPWVQANSFVLTAIPLFIFMGEILLHTGASEMTYRGASRWLAWAPGGLLHSNIGSCAMFAAISGSSAATAATIGTVAIPSLKKRGYDTRMTLGSLAAGGTLGILIPPSITMIVYGAIGGVSVGRLFAGGVLPGIMLSVMFMVFIGIMSIRNPNIAPREATFSLKGLVQSLVDLWPIVILMGVVLGGIFGGVFTPTEAAAVGASTALIIGLILRQLTWQGLQDSLKSAVVTACMGLFIIIGATMLGSVLALVGTGKALAAFLVSLALPPKIIVLIVGAIYLVLGCIMEGLAIIVVTTPIILPAMVAIGVDPVWFGVMLVVLVELGLLTPPVGVNLFIIQGISGSHLGEVFRGTIPFFLIMVVGFIIMVFLPDIVLWLPSIIFGS
jgi:tripartite ATP-independent transporter DctM subunit